MSATHTTRALACVALLAAGAAAQAPLVSWFAPRGGQRGTEVEVEVRGRFLQDLRGLVFQRPGPRVVECAAESATKAKIRVAIPRDCAPGAYPFRVHGAGGVSTLRHWYVGERPEVAESPPNNSIAEPDEVPFGCTINGSITPQDIDCFRVVVPEGKPLTVEVVGVRLGGSTFDPHLIAYDATGREIARADDTAFGRMDPWLRVPRPADGVVLLELRHATHGGAESNHYRVHVGAMPRPTAPFPCGGRPGERIEVTYLDETVDGAPQTETVLLPHREGLHAHLPRAGGELAPSPVWLWVRDLPQTIEPQADRASSIDVAVPSVIHGVLTAAGEIDRYRFEAKKGTRLTIATTARAQRSPVDPVVSLRQVDGSYRVASDDAGGTPDSLANFRAPADGKYDLLVYDRMRRGGPAHFYRVEIAPPPQPTPPRVQISFPGRRDLGSVQVPAGASMMTVLRAAGLPSGARLVFDGLPPGVHAHAAPRRQGAATFPVVFEAEADARPAVGLAGMHFVEPGAGVLHDAGYLQQLGIVRVRNAQLYLADEQRRLPVAVAEPLPFRISLETPKVPLVRGAGIKLRARVEREEGFGGSVRVNMPWVPPGVSAGSVTIPASKDEATISLSARGSAALGTWDVAIYGYVTASGGTRRTSSRLIPVEIVAPYLTAKGEPARTLQGKDTELRVALTPTEAWTTPARAELIGLPRGINAEPIQLAPGTKEAAFALQVTEKATAGKHRPSLRVTVDGAGGPVLHELGRLELRVDAPIAGRPAATNHKPGTLAKPKT